MRYMLSLKVENARDGVWRQYSGGAYIIKADNDAEAEAKAEKEVALAKRLWGPKYTISAKLKHGDRIVKEF